ncbi:hypothetical protein ON010_g12884 [Phytophthora cinnamomi]|nr:hypothetical protein ON010_g12884 [Phytophthora cinnamomi]
MSQPRILEPTITGPSKPDFVRVDPMKTWHDYWDACEIYDVVYCCQTLHVLPEVRIVATRHCLGFEARRYIPDGAFIGKYAAVSTLHDFKKDTRQYEYALELYAKTNTIFIDAETSGGITLFKNHSCK